VVGLDGMNGEVVQELQCCVSCSTLGTQLIRDSHAHLIPAFDIDPLHKQQYVY
jgi:hypothetical protein